MPALLPTKKFLVSASLSGDHKAYRRAGKVLTHKPKVFELTDAEVKALKADPKVSIVEPNVSVPTKPDEASASLKKALDEANDTIAQHELDSEALVKSHQDLTAAHESLQAQRAEDLKRIAALERDLATSGQAQQSAIARAEAAERENSELKAKLAKSKAKAEKPDKADDADPEEKKPGSRRSDQ